MALCGFLISLCLGDRINGLLTGRVMVDVMEGHELMPLQEWINFMLGMSETSFCRPRLQHFALLNALVFDYAGACCLFGG